MPKRIGELSGVQLRQSVGRQAAMRALRPRLVLVATSLSWLGGTFARMSVAHAQECVVQAQVRAVGIAGNSPANADIRLDTGEQTTTPATLDTGVVGPGAAGGHSGAQAQYASSADFGHLSLAANCYADTGNPYEGGALSMVSSDPGAAPNARFVDRLTVSHASESNVQVKLTEQLLGSAAFSGVPMASDDPGGVVRFYYWTNTGHGQFPDLPIAEGYTTNSAEQVLTIANGSYIDIEQTLQFFASCSTGAVTGPFRAEGLASYTAVVWVEVLTPGGEVTSCSGTNYVVDSSETDGATSSGTGGTDAGVTSASTTSEAQTTVGETNSDVPDASVSETSGPGVTDVATSQVASGAPSSSDTLVAETTGPVVTEATTSEPGSSVDTEATSSATHDTVNTPDYNSTTTPSEDWLDAGVVTSGVVSWSSSSSVASSEVASGSVVSASGSSETEGTAVVATSSVGETSSSTGPNLDITLETVGNSNDHDDQSNDTSAAPGSSMIADAGPGDAGIGTDNPQPSCECRTVPNPRSSAYRVFLPALAGLMLLRRRRQVRGAA